MKFSELIHDGEYTSISEVKDIEITRVSYRADDLQKGDLFILIKSINNTNERIIEYILSKSPSAIVSEVDISTDIPIIKVENARLTLSFIYSRLHKINYGKMKFIGITGTNGKTTTASMIKSILMHAGAKVGFIGTGKIEINGKRISERHYSMTTPDPDRLYSAIKEMEEAGCEAVVMEVSSHALALGKVAPIPYFCSAFTNLSPEHMDFHKNMADYYGAKLKLFYQSENGVFNADDEYSSKAMRELCQTCKTHSVGIIWDAESMARDVNLKGLKGASYIFREPNLIFKIYLNMPGTYNIYNSLIAIKCALIYGVSPRDIREAIPELDGVEGRFEIIEDDITVIIDYAHTAKAFENLLKTINSFKNQGQNIISVFGCGGERDVKKRPQIAKIAERYSSFSIVTTDNSRGECEGDIIADILSGFERTDTRRVITSRTMAITNAILSAKDGDIVAVIGKGHEKYNIDKNGYHDFDERKIIEAALAKRKHNKL